MLPPREGFSPAAIGAVGMMVRLLAGPADVVVGQDAGADRFATPRLVPVRPAWRSGARPVFGRTNQYMAGATRAVCDLRPRLVEVHNRANQALAIAQALPDVTVTLFLHNDPQGMRMARTSAQRAALLRHMAVVCVSDHLKRRFMDGVDAARTSPRVLPNAIDLDALPPALPADARDPVFLFVGRVVADKGADAFVRAFAAIKDRLPSWRAAMIGADRFYPDSPETPFLRALRPEAARAGIAMPGYCRHTEVLHAMARAAIVVVPSRWQEPFGLTALEAMASGAALICASAGGLPEVAGDAARFAAPDPPGALEDAMLRLALDDTARAAMAETGRQRARLFDAPPARARLQALRWELVRG